MFKLLYIFMLSLSSMNSIISTGSNESFNYRNCNEVEVRELNNKNLPFTFYDADYTHFTLEDILETLYDGVAVQFENDSRFNTILQYIHPLEDLNVYSYDGRTLSSSNYLIPDSYFSNAYGIGGQNNVKCVTPGTIHYDGTYDGYTNPLVVVDFARVEFVYNGSPSSWFSYQGGQYWVRADRVLVARIRSYDGSSLYGYDGAYCYFTGNVGPIGPNHEYNYEWSLLRGFQVSLDVASSLVASDMFSRISFIQKIDATDFSLLLKSPLISKDYQLGYLKGYQNGYSDGQSEVTDAQYNLGYTYGHEVGYTEGYASGVDDGYDSGYRIGASDGNTLGYQNGYNAGYAVGYDDAVNEFGGDPIINSIFNGIFQVGLLPVNVFLTIFNFEVFGINVAGLVSGLLTMSVLIIIVRFLFGGKNND